MELLEYFKGIIFLLALLIFISIAYGILLKLALAGLAAMAYPTYVGLITLEILILEYWKKKSKGSFLEFHIPRSGYKRLLMNLLGCFVTLVNINIGLGLYDLSVTKTLNLPDDFIVSLLEGKIITIYQALMLFSFVLTMYWISHSARTESDDPINRLEKLKTPYLFKRILGT